MYSFILSQWLYNSLCLKLYFHSLSKANSDKMFDIDHFLLEFENLIFDEHLTKLRSFKRRHGNAVSCSCFHINEEKEEIAQIMEKYSKLSKRLSVRLPLTLERSTDSENMCRDDKIRSGSYDVVG